MRHAAIRYLALLRQDRTIPVIAQLARSNKPIERTYALDALFYIKDERTAPLLIEALKDKNKSVRLYAIRSLERLGAKEAIPFYIDIISSDVDHEVRIRAIQLLSGKKLHRALKPIHDAVSDRHPLVRKEAINAVLIYNRRSSAKYFSNQLLIETEDDIKFDLMKAMLQLNEADDAAGLNKVILTEANEEVKLWAIYIAGRLKEKKTLSTLLQSLRQASNKAMVEASFALANFENSDVSDALYRKISDETATYRVRSAALYAYMKVEPNYLSRLQILKQTVRHEPLRLQIENAMKG